MESEYRASATLVDKILFLGFLLMAAVYLFSDALAKTGFFQVGLRFVSLLCGAVLIVRWTIKLFQDPSILGVVLANVLLACSLLFNQVNVFFFLGGGEVDPGWAPLLRFFWGFGMFQSFSLAQLFYLIFSVACHLCFTRNSLDKKTIDPFRPV